MGRGNVSVSGRCEGLYYVDYDLLDETNEYGEIDYVLSDFNRHDFEICFAERIMDRFDSFDYVNAWISNSRRAILENRLFYIVVEDNEWSLAIELIEKDVDGCEIGLQMGLYKKYLKAIEEILLDMNGEVGIYAGSWTHGTIRK